jgi:hypothetical protein
MRSYDDVQRDAREVSWLCCKRTVFATHPAKGCGMCRVPSVSAALHRQDLRVNPNEVRS